MARKTAKVVVSAEGRDKGKVFLLTEMPAAQVERWAMRAFLALARANVDIPDDVAGMGMAGIATLGLTGLSRLSFAEAEPLLEEMLACVQIIPDPRKPQVTRAVLDDDIEEVKTRLLLRKEIFTLHTGFSWPAVASNSSSTTQAGE